MSIPFSTKLVLLGTAAVLSNEIVNGQTESDSTSNKPTGGVHKPYGDGPWGEQVREQKRLRDSIAAANAAKDSAAVVRLHKTDNDQSTDCTENYEQAQLRVKSEVYSFFIGGVWQTGHPLYNLWGFKWNGRAPVIPNLLSKCKRNNLYNDPKKAKLANILGFEAGFEILHNNAFDVSYENRFNSPFTGPVYQNVAASWKPSMAYGEFHAQLPITDPSGGLKLIPSVFAGLEFARGNPVNTVNYYSATRWGAELLVQLGGDTDDNRRKGISGGVRLLFENHNGNNYWFNQSYLTPTNPLHDPSKPSIQFFLGIDLNMGKNLVPVQKGKATSSLYKESKNGILHKAGDIKTLEADGTKFMICPEEKTAYFGASYKQIHEDVKTVEISNPMGLYLANTPKMEVVAPVDLNGKPLFS